MHEASAARLAWRHWPGELHAEAREDVLGVVVTTVPVRVHHDGLALEVAQRDSRRVRAGRRGNRHRPNRQIKIAQQVYNVG